LQLATHVLQQFAAMISRSSQRYKRHIVFAVSRGDVQMTLLEHPGEDVLPEMRRIFAQRDSLLNSHTFKSSQDLWCRVLKEVASEHMPHAKRLLSAFLLAPPQAAACERAFAQITQLRKAL